ncbi:UNVERIFIED_CONTAM: hypothetical protein HDU68_002260 [Siphonaria sp. JEL0065]|nr:hypothetical protein HDU68_002260 [Siphonaria sp. JEL0065]
MTSVAIAGHCLVGPGFPTPTNSYRVTHAVPDKPTLNWCVKECAQLQRPVGINYGGLVQVGPYAECFCLVQFTPTPAVGACSPCVKYPSLETWGKCGSGNPSNGYIGAVYGAPV